MGVNVSELIDVLNGYPNVFFFWGHDHYANDLMGTILTAGDTIEPSDDIGGSREINFTYCNSGHMGNAASEAVNDGTGVRVAVTDSDGSFSVDLEILGGDGTVLDTASVDVLPSSEISTVVLSNLDSPMGGEEPDASALTSSWGVASPVDVTWSAAGVPLSPGDRFEAGTVYTATMVLTAEDGMAFTASTAATVNGESAVVEAQTGTTLSVSYEFPAAPEPSPTYWETSSITDGHEYAVVVGGAAMNTDAETGSAYEMNYEGLGYTMPTIDGDTLTFASAAEAAEATWTFTDAGSGQWYLSNQGNNVYAPESRTMRLDGTEKTPWTYATQLYASLYDSDSGGTVNGNLYCGTGAVDFFYPSVNNSPAVTLYEKVKPVDHIEGTT